MKRLRLPKRPAPAGPDEARAMVPAGFDRAAIEALLHDAVLEVLDGSPPGPLFATRVQRVCTEALRRAGIPARVQTENGGQHAIVWIRVGQRVERVVVSVGPR